MKDSINGQCEQEEEQSQQDRHRLEKLWTFPFKLYNNEIVCLCVTASEMTTQKYNIQNTITVNDIISV